MPSHPNDGVRASDAERERVVAHLRAASTEGRLTVDELEERTAHALGARTRAELTPLTRDLPSGPVQSHALSLRPARPRRSLQQQLVPYLVVTLLLIVVWAATGADYFWPIWPMLGWGIGIARHARHGDRRHHRHAPGLPPGLRSSP